MHTVAIAIFPDVQALDVAGPADVFAEANSFLPRDAHYVLELVSTGDAHIRASNGTHLFADRVSDGSADRYHTALVAGGPLLPTQPADARLCAWLVEVASHSERYGSICTGAFALGHAGLLDHRNVTTHWQNARQLAEQFPLSRVDFDRIYLRDERLLTSAGVTAGIDLALALVAEDHGAALALQVAKRLVVYAQRRGGQSQFSPYLSAPVDDSPIATVQHYVMEHIANPLTVEELARVAGMSTRSFARAFAESAEITPHEFVERARVDAARRALETSDAPLKTIAYECGFGNADRMRLVFARRIGVSPADYRASFRAR